MPHNTRITISACIRGASLWNSIVPSGREGRVCEGRAGREGRVCEGRVCEGRMCEGRVT